MQIALPDFLPGELFLERGTRRDYFALEQFHYLPQRPATWADVWRIRFLPERNARDETTPIGRVVAVGVLSWPVPCSLSRRKFLHRESNTFGENLRFANANIRTISRVVIHPQFRALGLATVLVRCLIEHCPTRYVEALAQMGRAHPFFEKAGMTRINPARKDAPVYFIFDRGEANACAA